MFFIFTKVFHTPYVSLYGFPEFGTNEYRSEMKPHMYLTSCINLHFYFYWFLWSLYFKKFVVVLHLLPNINFTLSIMNDSIFSFFLVNKFPRYSYYFNIYVMVRCCQRVIKCFISPLVLYG